MRLSNEQTPYKSMDVTTTKEKKSLLSFQTKTRLECKSMDVITIVEKNQEKVIYYYVKLIYFPLSKIY